MRIVLTGSSSGIGHALTLRLLQRGHMVWGLARSDQSTLTRKFPGKFFSSRCDVSDWLQIEAARDELTRTFKSIDALVTCAGIQGVIGRATELDPQDWSATVRANLDGTYFPIRALWSALMAAEHRAKIVCFSGGGSTKARPHFSAYGAAKTAIVRLVETIAAEEKSRRFDINAVAPGAIHTAMTEEMLRLGPGIVGAAEYEAAQKTKTSSEESLIRSLALVEWLLSPASDGVSGRLISAPWDPWLRLNEHRSCLAGSDIYTLRRILPEDRGENWT